MSRAPLVTDVWLDVMCFKQLHYLGQTSTRQSNVVGDILAARDYSRLVKCGKPHRLCLIEFRILKCGQPEQTVQHRRRQPVLLDIQEVCANDIEPRVETVLVLGVPLSFVTAAAPKDLARRRL